MLENKFIMFIILILALLSVGAVSAEESSLDINNTQSTVVSVNLMNDSSMDVIGDDNSLDVASEDNDIKTSSNNVNDLSGENTSVSIFSTNSTITNNDYKTNHEVNSVASGVGTTKTFTNLYALIAGVSGTTLTLHSNYKMTDDDVAMFSEGITLSKNININGNGFTIDANNLGRMFNIIGGTVTLTNVNLVNGNEDSYGGAIFNTGTLILKNVTFINNTASMGGAVYNFGNGFTLNGCAFINNTVEYVGGAICNEGGVNCTVSKSIFVNNTADKGSAIYCDGSFVANDNWWGTNNPNWKELVEGNVTHDTYAVLSLIANNGAIAVNFYNNGTSKVLSISRPVSLTIGNKNSSGRIVDGNFETDYEALVGEYNITAAVDNQELNITLINEGTNYEVYVDFNKGKDSNNGTSWSSAVKTISRALEMVHAEGTIYLADGTHVVNNMLSIYKVVSIVGNKSTYITNNFMDCGIFYAYVGNISIYNCNFVNNKVSDSAIIHNVDGANFIISNCAFINNSAPNNSVIYNGEGANFTIIDSTFVNSSANRGGVIYNDAGVNFTVCNSDFVNSFANFGGVIYNCANGVNFTVSNCIFINGDCNYGGAVFNGGANFSVSNSIFINNSALNGGAIYNVRGANFTIDNSTFINNIYSMYGSAIMNNGGMHCTVLNSRFENNSAMSGGAIYNMAVNCTVSNSIFANNTADDGGAIFSTSSFVANDNWWGNNDPDFKNLVNNNVVHDNYIVLNLVATNSTVEVNFYRNGTTEVLPISCNFTLAIGDNITARKMVNGSFKTNYACLTGNYDVVVNVNNQKLSISFIGKIYVNPDDGDNSHDGSSWDNAVKTIDKAIEIAPAGGEICLADGTYVIGSESLMIKNAVTIVGNGSKTIISGGITYHGVFWVIADNVAIYNCTFVNNVASSQGGVINNFNSNFTVSGCIFINNTATNNGSAIFTLGKNVRIINSIFINNTSGDGSVIYTEWPCVVDDNWWGINSPNLEKLVNELVTCNTHAVLNLTANDGTVVVNFYRNGTTEVLPISRDVVLTIGNQQTIVGRIVDGTFETSYKIPADEYDITAVVDNQEVIITLINEDTNYDVYVDSNDGDDSNNGSSWSNAVKTIDKALEIVPAKGTIYLADGTHIIENQIVINKNSVTIVGNGSKTVISNNRNGNGVFKITGNEVAIYNSTFVNSSVKYYGAGVITNYGHDFVIGGCSFVNNSAEYGGAIYNNGGIDFVVSGCSFVNNYAHGRGGAIYNLLGIITVTDSIFDNNAANMGVIYNWGTLNLNNNTYLRIGDGKTYIYNEEGILSSVNVTVLENKTISINTSKQITLFATVTCDGASVTGDTLKFLIDGEEYEATSHDDGNYTLDYTVWFFGEKIVNAVFTGADTRYVTVNTAIINASTFTPSVNVSKYDPMMNVTAHNITFGQNLTVDINLPADAKGNLTIIFDGNLFTKTIDECNVKLVFNNIFGGIHSIIIKYPGSEKYLESKVINYITVDRINPSLNVTVSNITVGENETITFTLPVYATGDVNITIGNDSYIVFIKDGVYEIANLSAGNYTAIVTYLGDINYNSITKNYNFTVSKVSGYKMDVVIPEGVKFGEDTIIKVDFPDDATGEVILTVDGEKYSRKVENATVTIPQLSVGIHNITATYRGDNKYNSAVKQGSITVLPNDVILTSDNVVMFYHDGTRLVAKLTDTFGNPIANEVLSFVLNGVTYNKTTNNNGSASISINLGSGNYAAVVTYWGNDLYNKVIANVNISVNPSIVGHDLVKMYQNDTQFHAKFFGKYGKLLANSSVDFNINGVLYHRSTDENGIASLNINLRPGNYILTAYNNVTGEELGFNIVVKSLIVASNLTKYYNNASDFQVTVYDKIGSLAVNKNVIFNINGVLYNHSTDENGIVKLAINLIPGDYVITTMVDGLDVSNCVKVLPTLITNDLSMTYHDGIKFSAVVLDGEGNPFVNQNVSFNVNGVLYNKVSNNDGVASLNINLNSGKYIITSIWDDYQVGNKITIS